MAHVIEFVIPQIFPALLARQLDLRADVSVFFLGIGNLADKGFQLCANGLVTRHAVDMCNGLHPFVTIPISPKGSFVRTWYLARRLVEVKKGSTVRGFPQNLFHSVQGRISAECETIPPKPSLPANGAGRQGMIT